MNKLTLVKFEKNFSLHDSDITKIYYDAENKKLIPEIDYRHWFENFDDKKILSMEKFLRLLKMFSIIHMKATTQANFLEIMILKFCKQKRRGHFNYL